MKTKFLKLEKLFLRLLFGKAVTNGYYTPPTEPVKKNYVFDSVFPSREAQETALNTRGGATQ